MQASPDLTIIILTYNTRELTLACLRSLARGVGDHGPIEVETLVVDNASTDGTVEAIRTAFPTANIVANATNLGFSRGNNAGLAVARGRYLFLLNSDTEVQPGALSALVTFMDAHPDAGACGPMLLNTDGTLQPSGRALPSVWRVFAEMTRLYRLWKRDRYAEGGRDYTKPSRVGEISGAALLVRRTVYEKTGGFDPNLFAYYEDIDWCKRIGDAGYSIYCVPEAKVMHLWRGTSRNVSELSYRAGQNSLRYYFFKHHGPVAHAAIQFMMVAKELAQISISLIRRDTKRLAMHKRMLANVFAVLPFLDSA